MAFVSNGAGGWVKREKTPEEQELDRLRGELFAKPKIGGAAKKASSAPAAPKKTTAPQPAAEEEMDPELAALLKKLDAESAAPAAPKKVAPEPAKAPAAPVAPVAAKKTSANNTTGFLSSQITARKGGFGSHTAMGHAGSTTSSFVTKTRPKPTPAAPPAPAAEEEMDPELAALLGKLNANPPSEKATTSTSTTSAPKSAAASSGPYVVPSAAALKRTIPSNINKAAIVRAVNEGYLKEMFEGLLNLGYLSNAPQDGTDWENYLCVDWDTILSDPLFVKEHGAKAMSIMGKVGDTRTTPSFHTSMSCWESTMRDPCHSLDTIDRNLMSSVTKFVITLDMTLPAFIEPKFIWDKKTKVLTFVHNPLSLLDGPAQCHYKFGSEYNNGSSFNYFLPLIYVMNDNLVPYRPVSLKGVPPIMDPQTLVSLAKYNVRDTPSLARSNDDDDDYESAPSFSSSRSSKASQGPKKCTTCNGTGNWGKAHNYKTCHRCHGAGSR